MKYQGVVCSMKESFGFIERADVVKEIFFHFSENKSKDDLQLGDDVEFIIQTRNVSFLLALCKFGSFLHNQFKFCKYLSFPVLVDPLSTDPAFSASAQEDRGWFICSKCFNGLA